MHTKNNLLLWDIERIIMSIEIKAIAVLDSTEVYSGVVGAAV